MQHITALLSLVCILCFTACTANQEKVSEQKARVFVGARIIDGTGSTPIENGVLLVEDGKISKVGPQNAVEIPEGTEIIDLSGKTVIPGLINTHGHVGDTKGLEAGHYSKQNVLDQLGLYARYGITTVVSLGGDGPESVAIRNAQDTATLNRARLYVAGAVVTGNTPEEAVKMVDENIAMPVDFIKIRVDDNLGASRKMPAEVYQAVINRAHEKSFPVATHMYYLADAKALLAAGSDYIAHSVRDQPVDEALISMLKEKKVCYCPTLTRDLSTFVYESVPDFFSDPFFLKEVDTTLLNQLKDPAAQQAIQTSKSAQTYKQALQMAMDNLKTLSDSGVTIAFGTDSGPPARFQGYFEHLEMQYMAKAGLSPMQILISATGDAAGCMGLKDVGTLEAGKWADFVVLTKNPLDDISNTKSIESVYIAGNQVPEKGN